MSEEEDGEQTVVDVVSAVELLLLSARALMALVSAFAVASAGGNDGITTEGSTDDCSGERALTVVSKQDDKEV